jgi:predicted nucleic acid-binding protein
MISTFTAFFDANVLFGARLRSIVLTLAQTGLFRARWSEDVHREWMAAVVTKRPDLTLESLERTRRAMDAAVEDCLVTDYATLIEGLTLPDPDDRHVLAAAIAARASVIVTFNGDDFPAEALNPTASTPSTLMISSSIWTASTPWRSSQLPARTCATIRSHHSRLKPISMTCDALACPRPPLIWTESRS